MKEEQCIFQLTGSIKNPWRKNLINVRMRTSWLCSHLNKTTLSKTMKKCYYQRVELGNQINTLDLCWKIQLKLVAGF